MTTVAEITDKLNAEIDALVELAEREAARAEWHDADRWHNQALGLITAREIIAAIGEAHRPTVAATLALRPFGHAGPERIPWFSHCGISHAADVPKCVACDLLAAIPTDAVLVTPESLARALHRTFPADCPVTCSEAERYPDITPAVAEEGRTLGMMAHRLDAIAILAAIAAEGAS